MNKPCGGASVQPQGLRQQQFGDAQASSIASATRVRLQLVLSQEIRHE